MQLTCFEQGSKMMKRLKKKDLVLTEYENRVAAGEFVPSSQSPPAACSPRVQQQIPVEDPSAQHTRTCSQVGCQIRKGWLEWERD
jgi:hypothetical protein